MATSGEWAWAYARQAHADFQTWQSIEGSEDVHPCHRMLFLQMACEKLCKARLIDGGTPPESLQSSHGYVANPLPLVIRAQLEFMGEDQNNRVGLLKYTRYLASEIEVLNPAVDRNGQRPDNCEYPWEDDREILHSPLDWQYIPLQRLRDRFGPSFVKLLKLSINRALQKLQQ
ncbi:hypothetical protein KIH39_17225 [Telmatocola sphagniphila]|uniref:Uncharacterized protein n=1 Tax=Telmatocola sphagniphila TaxID=1123043 RepID=A0A8E6B3E1_9BACT|nr:hypothetical protein [Telmatocola sphagniphila]QVL30587.1 hypothetical protein KIH39_17225 [Telmatocola sphagniphila]